MHWVLIETSGNNHRQVEDVEDLQMENCDKGRHWHSSNLPNPNSLRLEFYSGDPVSTFLKNLAVF